MATSHPLIGVVVPVFGHSRLVGEALVSILDQIFEGSVVTAVVVDGDPAPETTLAVRSFAGAGDRPIYTLFRRNGRLPAARNAGIDLLLQLHPDLDAIYFLDADNRLSPQSLSVFWQTLCDNPSAAWAYPDIGFIGLTWGAANIDFRQTAPVYDPLRHLMGNICEAGSMVRGDVFRNGLRFDETFNTGYEDWEFWLQCLDQGLVGAPATGAGFQYRRRSDSMLAEADRTSSDIKARILIKHHRLFSRSSIVEKFRQACAPYLLATGDGGWRLLSAEGDWFREGATTLTDLIVSAREHFHFTYLPRLVLLPVGDHNRPPNVTVERTLALLADPPASIRTTLGLEPSEKAESSDGFQLIPIRALAEQTEPRLVELAAQMALIDRPSAHRMDRRYAGPAAFQIEQFVRERLAVADAAEAPGSNSTSALGTKWSGKLAPLLIDTLDRWASHPLRPTLERRFPELSKPAFDPQSLTVSWTRFAGRLFPYYDKPLEFAAEPEAKQAEFAVIVADSRALFYAGELKRVAKKVSFVAPRLMLEQDYAAVESAEHALSEIYCTPETAIRLRSAGIPVRKIIELGHAGKGDSRVTP